MGTIVWKAFSLRALAVAAGLAIRAENEKWGKVAKTANIRLD